MAEEFNVDTSKILPESSFGDNLGIDSLGYIVLLQAIEEEFNIELPDEETKDLKTVADAVKYIESKIQE